MQDESKRDRRGAHHKNDQRRRPQADQRVRECFADVVFVDHSSLNGMRGALVSADEFVTSWRQPLKDAQAYTLLGNFELLPAQESISAEYHAHILYGARRPAVGDIRPSDF